MSAKDLQDTSSPAPPTVAVETLHRHLSFWNSLPLGFAMVSPVVGLYAIMGVQTAVTGGGWFVALAICLVMQLLVATVYAELASQFPIAGGAYKGGIWLAIFFGASSSSGFTLVLWGVLFLAICMVLNLVHTNAFKMTLSMGVYAEMVGSVGVALLLFFFFRQHDIGELFQHLGTGTAPGPTAAFLAALAIAGWAFIGFDACSTIAEETLEPKRNGQRRKYARHAQTNHPERYTSFSDSVYRVLGRAGPLVRVE